MKAVTWKRLSEICWESECGRFTATRTNDGKIMLFDRVDQMRAFLSDMAVATWAANRALNSELRGVSE